MNVTLQGLKDSLSRWQALELPSFGRTDSAVLVPIVEQKGELMVILTRRSPHLKKHAGEVCFPGGTAEPGDRSTYATALREASEEIGIGAEECTWLGSLDDSSTVTGFKVRAHVALVEPGAKLVTQDSEVDSVLHVPLSHFLGPHPSYTVFVEAGGLRGKFPLFSFEGHVIWGATARMLANLGRIVRGAPQEPFERVMRALMPRILGARKVLLTTHVNPDPDGLGAQVAMEEFLIALGKNVVIANGDAIPERFSFLSFRSPLYTGIQITDKLLSGADLMIVLDTAERERTGRAGRLVKQMGDRVAVLDHHLAGNIAGEMVLVDRTYCSASEIVYEFLTAAGYVFSDRAANALYAGIMFDTHGFRYVANRSQPFKVAGHLVDMGADAVLIQEQLFGSVSAGHVQALAVAMQRMESEFSGRWVWSYISATELAGFKGTDEDAGDIAPFFVAVDGVQVATFLRELDDGRFKVSFRSMRNYPIGHICSMLGGGGHANAGGATVASSVQEIITRIRPEIERTLSSPSD